MSAFRKILIFRAKNDINGAVKDPVLSIHVRKCPLYVRTKNPLSAYLCAVWSFCYGCGKRGLLEEIRPGFLQKLEFVADHVFTRVGNLQVKADRCVCRNQADMFCIYTQVFFGAEAARGNRLAAHIGKAQFD